MFLRRGFLFFAILGLLICTGKAAAGPNANAVLSLDLIADGGAGNQRDDGVTSGTVSGQGTEIAVEVFATGVTTPLQGMVIEFDFDASVLTYVEVRSSAFPIILSNDATGTALAVIPPAPLSESGFLGRAEFTTSVDVTGREFSIGIKRVVLAEGPMSSDDITTTEVIAFNAPSSPDFNGDGIVDLLDYDLFRFQWGTRAGGNNWVAKFDLNSDRVIDLLDYDLFRSNWGKTFPVTPRGEMVSIPDMNLRAVIEDSLGKASGAPITRDEMATLTRFAVAHMTISDLTGLEFATNLTALALYNTSISDISLLSNLTNLRLLILDINSISDLTPLSNLTNLQGLWLQNNSISDLSPLVANMGLGSGDQVQVKDNPLSVTSINTHIPALQGRGVTVFFDVIDPTPVSIPDANLRAEIEDALDKSSGETITRGDMSKLTRLDARNANISDLTGLEFAIFLTNLDLGTEFVSGEGQVNSNHISDLSPLSGLNNLISLDLDRNSISDVSVLSGMSDLGFLRLEGNLIEDLSPLSGLTSLRTLDLDINSITDISPLSDLTSLTRLDLDRNTISDLTPLSSLTNLERLWLFNNLITDLSPLSGLTNLTSLNLGSNSITDVSALSGLTSLASLYLFSNSITDVSALSGLTSLTNLRLNGNSITDLSPLVANTGLGSGDQVNIQNNPLSTTSINTHIPALQGRGVRVQF